MKVFDRVGQQVVSEFDHGVVLLGPARTSMQTLRAAGGDGPFSFRYLLTDATESAWQIGLGSFGVSNPSDPADHGYASLDPFYSSNGGSEINLPTPSSGPHGYLYVVLTAADAVLTDAYDAPSAADGISRVLAIGGSAFAGAESTIAIGPGARALSSFSSALGYNTIAGVPGAYVEGDHSDAAQRTHMLRWAARAVSIGTTSVDLLHGGGERLQPRDGAAYLLDVRLIGRRTAPIPGAWAASARVLVHRSVGGSAEIVGAPVFSVDAASAGVTCSASLSIVSGGLNISAAGSSAGEAWRWGASVMGVEQWGN